MNLLNKFTGLRFVLSSAAVYLGRFYLLQWDSQWNVHGLYRVSRRVFKSETTLHTPRKKNENADWDVDKILNRTGLLCILLKNNVRVAMNPETDYITLTENNN